MTDGREAAPLVFRLLPRCAGIAALVTLVPVVYVPGNTLWAEAANNSAHGPMFAAVAWLALGLVRTVRAARAGGGAPGSTVLGEYALALGVTAALGLATEIIQYLGRRDAALGDLMFDVLGAVAALLVRASIDPAVVGALGKVGCASRRVGLLMAAAVTVLILAAPGAVTAAAYAQRSDRFPVLLRAESSLDLYFVRSRRSRLRLARCLTEGSDPAARGLWIESVEPHRSGMLLLETLPDWTGYTRLAVDVENPSDVPVPLLVEVGAEEGAEGRRDRAAHRFVVPARTRMTELVSLVDIGVGAPARFSLAAVHVLYLFFDDESADGPPRAVCLGGLWLQ